MLRTYLYKNLVSHTFNQSVGGIVLIIFSYLAINHPKAIGFRDQYDIVNSVSDLLLFASFFLILAIVIVQFVKGYLLYIPSTYLSFDSVGISFKRFKKEYQFIKWEDIQVIELKVESEWLLNVFIKNSNGDVVRVELTELWLLSIAKKWCVHHNFLKLAAIANDNPALMKKLIPEQVETLYQYSGVKL